MALTIIHILQGGWKKYPIFLNPWNHWVKKTPFFQIHGPCHRLKKDLLSPWNCKWARVPNMMDFDDAGLARQRGLRFLRLMMQFLCSWHHFLGVASRLSISKPQKTNHCKVEICHSRKVWSTKNGKDNASEPWTYFVYNERLGVRKKYSAITLYTQHDSH